MTNEPKKRGPGRPVVGVAVSMRLPTEMVERIDIARAADGISRAEWLRNAASAVLDPTPADAGRALVSALVTALTAETDE